MTFHGRVQPSEGVHTPFAWIFADAASRTAFTPTTGSPLLEGALTAADIHRVALQLDDGTQWRLASLGPTAWVQTGGAVGGVSTDAIWDAKGDLAVGTGSNTAARLPAGANDHVLTLDSAEATGLKWAAVPGGAGGVTVDYAEGFAVSPARGYSRGADPLSAVESFTAVAVFSPLTNDGGSVAGAKQQAFGTRGTANDSSGGWGIQVAPHSTLGFDYARIEATFTDFTGTPRTLGADIPIVNKWLIVHFRVTSAGSGSSLALRLFLNGASIAQVYNGGAGGQYTAGGNLCAGVYNDGATGSNSDGFPGRIHGCGYATAAMTDTEVAAHAQAVIEAGELGQTPSGTALADGWRARVSGSDPDATDWDSFLSGTALTTLNGVALTLATKADPVLWG